MLNANMRTTRGLLYDDSLASHTATALDSSKTYDIAKPSILIWRATINTAVYGSSATAYMLVNNNWLACSELTSNVDARNFNMPFAATVFLPAGTRLKFEAKNSAIINFCWLMPLAS